MDNMTTEVPFLADTDHKKSACYQFVPYKDPFMIIARTLSIPALVLCIGEEILYRLFSLPAFVIFQVLWFDKLNRCGVVTVGLLAIGAAIACIALGSEDSIYGFGIRGAIGGVMWLVAGVCTLVFAFGRRYEEIEAKDDSMEIGLQQGIRTHKMNPGYEFFPYMDPLMISAQILSFLTVFFGWITYWTFAMCGLPAFFMLQAVWFGRMSKAGLGAIGVVAALASIGCIFEGGLEEIVCIFGGVLWAIVSTCVFFFTFGGRHDKLNAVVATGTEGKEEHVISAIPGQHARPFKSVTTSIVHYTDGSVRTHTETINPDGSKEIVSKLEHPAQSATSNVPDSLQSPVGVDQVNCNVIDGAKRDTTTSGAVVPQGEPTSGMEPSTQEFV